ncbi:sodium-coupled monocarboxylate transporter 1-like isoform X2 [Oreochromis aureus]|uniref:sodium-coupled monocarboxylate transporter 1-like isoform X2 n=1 Tax=Oreochromis aureus TaxID=47969 RepID=UPI001954252A|nr:sodium-coupled monocarboxylate transporter 1-like isoform X2 [Oreochromis aureus]
MSGDAHLLVAADYVVFAVVLLLSAAVGFYYAWRSRKQGTSRDFLTGGRKLNALAVSMSLTASYMSSVTVLSNPAEVYRYGAIFGYLSISYVLAVVYTSEVFLPVFYRLAINSTYEYLELRFSRATRLLAMLLYTGLVIYAPALALNQVTGMNLWGGIISTATVCTLYCALGGLKAVVWTDVVQIGIMFAGYMSVIIKCVILKGGISTILSDAQEGGRINFVDFDINPLRRHTFWTLVIGGTFGWSAVYGTYQPQVQRYNSCKTIKHARLALFINVLGLACTLTSSVISGLCLYSFYKNCDPWKAGQVSSPDQLLPYLVMDILADHQGLPGLFFAAVYSASLSTVSTSINAMAAVTMEDLIKPRIKLSEKKLLLISKGLSLFFGIVCVAMAGLASLMGHMMQAVSIIGGVCGGPLLGLFSLGVLCPFVNSKGGLWGLVAGLAAAVSVTIGEIISPSPPEMTRPLSLSTEGCNFSSGGSLNWTTPLPTEPSLYIATPGQNTDDIHVVQWHSPSYLYFVVIGGLTAIIVGIIISLLTGGLRETVDPRLMLMKEDTLSYHLFKRVKDGVMGGTDSVGQPNKEDEINKPAEEKFDNTCVSSF